MTKKHFEKIAAILKDARLSAGHVNSYETTIVDLAINRIAHNLCHLFEKTNPRFNKERFFNATLPTSPKKDPGNVV